MLRPLALYIGLRYTRAKRRHHFISFISLASMLGIAIGVAVLITVLSVMNGFDDQIRTRFFSIAPEVTVIAGEREALANQVSMEHQIATFPEVVNLAPFVSGIGLLNNEGNINPVNVFGIEPREEAKISKLQESMISGSLESLKPGHYNIVLGNKLALSLGLALGDKVLLLTPQASSTPVGPVPKLRRFTLSGIFDTKSGFGFDSGLAYIHQQDAKKLFPQGEFGWHVKIKNIYAAPRVTRALQQQLPSGVVSDWTEQFGPLFQALAMEKTIMFVILLLIVGVAVFNLVSTLVMVVNDKRADIAILRTLGASPGTIMAIFIIQGAIIGLVGIFLGAILGVILSLNATALVNELQQLFHVQFVNASVYFIDFLPSKLYGMDVVRVSLAAFIMSILATIYPAILAFRTQPVEALRYE